MNGEVARARLSGPASCLPFFEYYLTSVWVRISATLPQAGKSGPAPGFCASFWGQNRGQNSFLPSSRMAENLKSFHQRGVARGLAVARDRAVARCRTQGGVLR